MNHPYQSFWTWFQKNELFFFEIIKTRPEDIEELFFDPLTIQLDKIKEDIFYLAGMKENGTAELIFTADGEVKNIAFVEKLVESAPSISKWKFTALKSGMIVEDLEIRMEGLVFDKDNLSFFATVHPSMPDEIDITIVHHAFQESEAPAIMQGTHLFLDNYLGELASITNIDDLKIIGQVDVGPDQALIPIEKLEAYLNWRQKEFIEKYEGIRYDTANDSYKSLEAEVEDGGFLIAIVNADLLEWDSKASHPWICLLDFKFDDQATEGPSPVEKFANLDEIEAELLKTLKDTEGHLYIGHISSNGSRRIYFACQDFRKISKVLYQAQENHSDQFEVSYEIYKDKYWQSFERFRVS